MDRGEDFVLLEALPEKSYRRSHLPGAINLPPRQTDQAEELIPASRLRSLSTARVHRELSPRRSPVELVKYPS
jgi:hypothetical protein